ncbi:type II toxin-antitoxin system VapC family toxin [Rhizobium sp. SL86]|uniref:type II toxin-antitoxin system VapC family toxin n=1 Tax=Rhizobium sp. SL86 TaxID=2995148 RepID=UPI0022739CB4|nr:type II toxin-antitoxin system VapC family toxin [Rhizobium sp. SL86]MCY1664913.1 type II toxin-antitoxin system VapC family toxin [Rhizobium sp. SL86]
MKVLLDSHILVWSAAQTNKLSAQTRAFLEDPDNVLFFSSASLWELSVKHALGKGDIPVHPRILYQALQEQDFYELPLTSQHTFVLETLPPIHKDPFDRILIAQATSEDMLLLTSDATIARYDGPIRLV